ncbi:MAG: cupin domain-containing protein [Actinomycetota bacterium]|nr:cupin domain-containing protein [Actinomycetota bacterium]
MGITHFDEARSADFSLGHLTSHWTFLGEAAGCATVGLRRLQVPSGHWSTPAHEHGREEEIFYVLAGRGLSWQSGRTAEVETGDCIVHMPRRGAHSLQAIEPLDVLAFGTRCNDESPRFPRLGISLVGNRAVESATGAVQGAPVQFLRESALGPPECPEQPGPRPANIVNLADAEPVRLERPRVVRERRNLGRAAGSVTTGLQHVEVAAGKEATAQHCHSVEEEIFVVLAGSGMLVLGFGSEAEESAVGPGHVISRPAGTGIAHVFRAGAQGLTFLAYGTRDPSDLCYYPRSGKIAFRGVGLIGRIERLDYWDGED